MKFIKKIIPKHIKVYIYDKYENYKLNKKYNKIKEVNRIFIFGSPVGGNLGDQAIIVAEKRFLMDNYPNYEIIDIDLSEYYRHIKFIKKYINNDEVIFLHGGGNLGNQYIHEENIRRDVVRNFPNNKIVLFPQTMYFINDENGKEELENSKKIYGSHPNLTLVSREKISFKLMKENFKNNTIILTPDIVLYLNKSKNKVDRKGALFCMRGDLESKFTDLQKKEILELLKSNYDEVKVTDTVVNENITKDKREVKLNEKFNEFANSELVITDRIHGMIFAAITSTPCIALSNYNQKVIGTYEWIKNLDYIKFANNINEVNMYINELKVIKKYKYDNSHLLKYYSKLLV